MNRNFLREMKEEYGVFPVIMTVCDAVQGEMSW
jgi:hypothetical protein